ncbi:clavesin-1-like isoform X4 [Centruroides vittatus]|uniref:clavesin-1-like isoform X4 n=1 Tax=Centruroides vittatus TaxID=120091 RepID=UPI00350FC97E
MDFIIKTWTNTFKTMIAFCMVTLEEEQLKCRSDDIFLLSFLRARKYDRERALKLLKNYYATRKKYTDIFKDLRPSALESFLQMGMMCIKRLENGQVLGLGRVSHWDATKVRAIDVARCILLLIDMELNDHPMQVNGLYVLIDVKTFSWRHFIQFTPTFIYLLLSSLYFHIHGSNMEKLHKEIEPKYLNAEFGCELSPFDASETNQKLRDIEELFVENEKYWTEEKNT